MLVSVAIAVGILSVVVFNQSKYSSASTLSNSAHSLSQSITEAQTYSVSVKEFGTAAFGANYGVQLKRQGYTGGGSNTEYIFYADHTPKNNRYDGSWNTGASTCPTSGASSAECIKKNTLGRNVTISNLCWMDLNDITNGTCQNSVGGGANTISRVDIAFVRPETKAKIYIYNNSGFLLNAATLLGVRITLTSSVTGTTKYVYVYANGQVSVQ